jgi:flavin reductase (DIM6/NTAB) family NADH-FMN oxidoreductase RutF/DNA-binding GntR family transcriptional regulator
MSLDSSWPPTQLDQHLFRDVIGHFASGVTVITAEVEDRLVGTTASAVSSLSMEPPMLLVCLNRSSETGVAVAERRSFAVNILREDQGDLATHFATKGADKFRGIEVVRGEGGLPLLADSLAQLECEVAEIATGGTHRIFLAEVRTARSLPGAPLTYFRGRFGRFTELRDESAYHQLRLMVLDRKVELGAPLEVRDLARRLGLGESSVFYAMTRLTEERLVQRRGPATYEITPIDERLLRRALDARCALTLGVVTQALGDGVSDEDVAKVRSAAEQAVPDGEGLDPEEALDRGVVMAFHEQIIRLARNEILLDVYRALSLPAIMARALWGVDVSEPQREWSAQRIEFADLLERRDRDGALRCVITYNESVKSQLVETIRAAGGQL